MTQHISIICNAANQEECARKLADAIKKHSWVSLLSKPNIYQHISTSNLPEEPGIILQGGGSSGRYHKCLHQYSHFDQSALATAEWIKEQGFNPQKCHILNPLPINHVSGLLPWWRSRCWGAQHKWITNKLMRDPINLEKETQSLLNRHLAPILTSIVPTQLHRLLQYPSGIRWLQLCSIIWIGGSPISTKLAAKARSLKIRLAPCYGTTETAAMVTVQTPEAFLSGENSLGTPLPDVELRLGRENSLQIRTQRLSKTFVEDGTVKSIEDIHGWWESGDIAELTHHNQTQQLRIIGRRDTAINVGGEIIFPEILQARLQNNAHSQSLPIEALLLVPVKDEEWGERLVALVKLKPEEVNLNATLKKLKNLVNDWSSLEKPLDWYSCPELEKNHLGKWEINKWKSWAILKRANTSI